MPRLWTLVEGCVTWASVDDRLWCVATMWMAGAGPLPL